MRLSTLLVAVAALGLFGSCSNPDSVRPRIQPTAELVDLAGYGVVNRAYVSAMAQPREDSDRLFVLEAGDKLVIKERGAEVLEKDGKYDYWYRFSYKDREAWIFGADFDPIKFEFQATAHSKNLHDSVFLDVPASAKPAKGSDPATRPAAADGQLP